MRVPTVVTASLVVAIAACTGGGGKTAASTSTASTARASSTTRPANDLRLRIELAHRTFVAGSSASGAVVVTNRTGAPLQLRTAAGCKPKFAVVVGNSAVQQHAAFPMVCELAALLIRKGVTRLPFVLPFSYLSCVGSAQPQSSAPECLVGPNRLPPLPAGRYRATFQDLDTGLPSPPPVSIRVEAEAPSNR